MRSLIYFVSFLLCFSCTEKQAVNFEEKNHQFQADLAQLQSYFHIPGMAVLIQQNNQCIYENYVGMADLSTQKAVDSTTVFPIASISKLFAASIIFQLKEEGKLSLEESASMYLPTFSEQPKIKIKHLLSHTSQGTIGNEFVYSSRFGLLTSIIEKVCQDEYPTILQKRIIEPLGLKNTYGLVNQEEVEKLKNKLAKPYFPPQETGVFDPGLSTSTGIASTVRDLAQFHHALVSGKLINTASLNTLTSPFLSQSGEKLPYGLGIFSKEFLSEKIVWGYGQNDCFSSLYLYVPQANMTLMILANNPLLSDPARLINGHIEYSLFALAFLEHYIFNYSDGLDFFQNSNEEQWKLYFNKVKNSPKYTFYQQKMRAMALSASFLGNITEKETKRSHQLLMFNSILDEQLPHDFSSLHNLVALGEQEAKSLPYDTKSIAEELILQHPESPYGKVYLGFYHSSLNQKEEAAKAFESLLEIPHLSPNWYILEALNYLAIYYANSNVELANQYNKLIIDIGWNYSGMVDKAKKRMLIKSSE